MITVEVTSGVTVGGLQAEQAARQAGDAATLAAAATDATTKANAAQAAANATAAAAYAPIAPSTLSKWFAGGIRGKKIVLVGDSTSDFAYGLNRALTSASRRGQALFGVGILNYGRNGQTLAAWLADTGGRYGVTSTVAAAADLYVLCYGVNDVSQGALTEDQMVALLGQAVDALTANGATVLLRTPATFTTSNTGTLNFITPQTPAAAQAYSTLLRNAYVRVSVSKSCPLLDTQALVFGLTSQADTASPYMLNQLHPNDMGNVAVARELVKMIGADARTTPLAFSMPGRVATGTIGRITLTNGGRIAVGIATYKASSGTGSVTVEFRKYPAGGGSSVLGTAVYTAGVVSTSVYTPAAALADWITFAAGDALEVAVTGATATINDLDVYVTTDDNLKANTYPWVLRYDGLRSSLSGGVAVPASDALTSSQERTIGSLTALKFMRLGTNRIPKYDRNFSQSAWTKTNCTVAGTAGSQVITATAGGASVFQALTVTPGESLTFAWKATTTAASPHFAVYDLTNGAFITGATINYPAADGAGWRSYSFTVPGGCVSLRVYPVGNSGGQGTAGDTYTVTATLVSSGSSMGTYSPINSVGTDMILSTGALPSDFTIINAVKVDGFVSGQVSVVSPGGPNTDGNPALQAVNVANFGYPVVTTRGTVARGALGSWQIAVLRATGGNVYVTLNDQPTSTAYAKAVNATDLRWNLVSAGDVTGSFQNWDGEVIAEYWPYLLTEGDITREVRSITRTLLAAGETLTSDWPAQKVA